MTMKKVFAVYDKIAETYGRPFVEASVAVAARGFEDACKNPELMFNKHPEHFVLRCIGDFDEQTGAIKSSIVDVGEASEYTASPVDEETKRKLLAQASQTPAQGGKTK